MRDLIYRRLKDCFVPPWWMACAYRDWARNQYVWVVWPLHYLVQFIWWLNFKWNGYRSKRSWIDRQVEAKQGASRGNNKSTNAEGNGK